jgi:hypothetical protein
LVKFIEVATAEPKFEDPPATRNGNIYYPQNSTNGVIPSVIKHSIIFVCIPF